jgi:MoxR-like ATPase
MVKRVTDRAAVVVAMDEFDRIGREAFLEKYKFGQALRYFITRNGRRYDSKAIYGAAHRNQFPEEGDVTAYDFSGGEQVVQGPLKALGFEFAMKEQGTSVFSRLLTNFLTIYGRERSAPFKMGDELREAMGNLRDWIAQSTAISKRPTIKVEISVGKGVWTKTPWIALLDERETTTTQKGTYIVFLIAEDLSVTYLTLNQGMTELRNRLKDKGAADEMVRVAEAVRPMIQDLESSGFHLNNNVDLRSETAASKKYEIGTIAQMELPNDNLPDDKSIEAYLEGLLSAYEKIIDPDKQDPITEPEDNPLAVETIEPERYSIEDALNELFLEREEVERYLETWKSKKNLILQGAPGVGKSFIARRLAYALIGFRDDQKIRTVQFHQSYSYEDFVQGYRPNGSQGFERKNGAFYEFRDRAMKDPSGTYVFIIDEINRGNLSKIFGELMLLIETDKRDLMWATRLAYASESDADFYVPENLHILGMMNTADRSLSLVDYALRRRFAFVSMDPLYGSPKFKVFLQANGVPESVVDRITTGMSELNQAIESDRVNLGPGFRIGHSFFTPTGAVEDADAWYRRVVETEIYPLLEEYWFDSPEIADQWCNRLLG